MDAIKISAIILLAAAPALAKLDPSPHYSDIRRVLKEHYPDLSQVNSVLQDGRVHAMVFLPLGEGKSRRFVIVGSFIGEADDELNIEIAVWYQAWQACMNSRKLYMNPSFYAPEKRTGAERPASR